MVISVAGTSHSVSSRGEALGVGLLPGVYMVTEVRPESPPAPPPSWDEPALALAAP